MVSTVDVEEDHAVQDQLPFGRKPSFRSESVALISPPFAVKDENTNNSRICRRLGLGYLG